MSVVLRCWLLCVFADGRSTVKVTGNLALLEEHNI